jgi:hypothetical protein
VKRAKPVVVRSMEGLGIREYGDNCKCGYGEYENQNTKATGLCWIMTLWPRRRAGG